MEIVIGLIVYLLVNIWATVYVARRVPLGLERTLLLAAIWLLPCGLILAILIAAIRGYRPGGDPNARMIDAIADEHRQAQERP